jgi:hypothetical protein
MPYGGVSISGDGNTIAGFGQMTSGGYVHIRWPFLWASGVTSDAPQADYSEVFQPFNISGDGLTITGAFGDPFYQYDTREASIWVSSGGLSGTRTDLGVPAGSAASASSYDGSVIGGFRPDASVAPIGRGFIWESGSSSDIEMFTKPHSISDDYNIVTSVVREETSPGYFYVEPWINVADSGIDMGMRDYLWNDFGFSFGDMPYGGGEVLWPYGLLSGDGTTFSMGGSTWVAKTTPISAVILGDSFSSGEGVPPFQNGTAAVGLNECHRSNEAYAWGIRPRRGLWSLSSMREAGGAFPVPGYSWNFLACSGAVTKNLKLGGTPQWPSSSAGGIDHGVSQLEQGPMFGAPIVDDETDLIVLTIGGNDAYFSAVVEHCAVWIDCHLTTWNPIDSWFSPMTLQEWFFHNVRNVVRLDLEDLYQDVKNTAPNAAIVVMGYPLLYESTVTTCVSPIDQNERAFFIRGANLLTETIRKATAKKGVHYAAGISVDFLGHGLCGTKEPWIHEIQDVFVGDNKVYSLHPTGAGQRAYAELASRFLYQKGIDYEHGFFESGLPKNPDPIP